MPGQPDLDARQILSENLKGPKTYDAHKLLVSTSTKRKFKHM